MFSSLLLLFFLLFLNLFILWGLFGFFRGAIAGAPFVPTEKKMVQEMLLLAGDLKGKKVYDLGCGDGRIVFAAQKKGSEAVGIEISFPIFLVALVRKWIQKSNATIVRTSLWEVDICDADIIFVYLLPAMMQKFEQEKYQTLKKGCIIISHGFALPNHIPFAEVKKGMGKRVLGYEVQ